MRIAILTREYLDETRWGGIGTFYRDLAERLAAGGHEVEVFTQGLATTQETMERGVFVHRCMPRAFALGPRRGGPLGGTPPRLLGLFALALAREVAQAFARRSESVRFDVVESHEHLGIGALIHDAGGTHLVRLHTAYRVLVERALEPWPRSRLVNALEARALRRARLRVSPSEFIANVTREHFPDLPGTDVHVPLATPLEPVPEETLEQKENLAVFVGRLSRRKRPLVAAEALAHAGRELPEWRFELAGADDLDSRGVLLSARCGDLLAGVGERWCYRGPLTADEIRALFRRAAVALIPSSFESFGLVAVEAMSQGCVPIVTSGGALAEVVGDGGQTVPLDDPEALAKALVRLARHPSERLAVARRGLRRARERYSPERVLERNVELLRLVARGESLATQP